MSLLLGKKDILLINTKLAVIIGLNDAVVLQQLSYWLEETTSGIEHDGMRWIYNTHEQWQEQFPFWSIDTVKRSFASLHKRELIFVKQLAAAMRNQTNYYAINQPAVDALHQGILPSSRSARCPDPKGQIAPIQKGKMPRSSSKTETTTETTTEILPAAPTALPAVIEIGLPAKQKKPRAKAEPDAETEAAKANRQAAWSAFDDAYQRRYGTTMTRNATTNSQMASLVRRLGQEAPGVAAFFVGINDAFLVRTQHGLGALLQNAEGYRTQWATGRTMTATRATQIDKTQSNFDAAEGAKAILRARWKEKNAE